MPALRRLRSDVLVLSRDQPLRLGFSRSDIDYRLRAGLWWVALPQVYFVVADPRRRDRLRAVLLPFLWPELGAILEIDSAEFHYRRDDWASPLARHRELETMGYSVIHIRPAELRNPRAFVAAVRRWLAGRRVMRASA